MTNELQGDRSGCPVQTPAGGAPALQFVARWVLVGFDAAVRGMLGLMENYKG
jgi:hypothetical protein